MELDTYIHCTDCLKKDPHNSGVMEIGIKDNMFQAICFNCKKQVSCLPLTEELKQKAEKGCFNCEDFQDV